MPENPTQPNPIYLIYMYKEDLVLNNPNRGARGVMMKCRKWTQ